MKKYVLFALVALFFVSSSAWAQYVKVTAENGTVSWIEIKGTIDGTNIEIYKSDYSSAIDKNTSGAIDLWNVWSESGERGTHYRVTSIGNGAFYQCSGLTSVVIPNSVTTIGGSAFRGCSGLTSITIPSSVTNIGWCAFVDCSGLTTVTINSNDILSRTYTSSSNLSNIFGTQVTKYVLGEDITSIGKYAFYYSTSLTSIDIPSSVTSIGDRAFYGCSLTSIEIPSSVTSIGVFTFAYCGKLTSVNIPSSVTSIGRSAFYHCIDLISIEIPSSVTSIGERAFWGCGFTSITSYITEVFETGYEAFYGCNNATLFVPKGLVDTYKSTADWNSISNIVEMSNQYDVNGDGSIDISDVVFLVNVILSSSTTDDSYDVNGDGSVDISDVVSLVNTILNRTGTGTDDNSQAYLTCPDGNHPHIIDLGLPSGTKWACCNVGADKPEAYGGYYAWGETEEKSEYCPSTYKFAVLDDSNNNGNMWDMGNYYRCQNIGTNISGSQYDVAHVKWGVGWHIPTRVQIKELVYNTTSEFKIVNGVVGRQFTGSNGGTIFLPAAGYQDNGLCNAGFNGEYWSSTFDYGNSAYGFSFYGDGAGWYRPGTSIRSKGLSVRPVTK